MDQLDPELIILMGKNLWDVQSWLQFQDTL